MLGLNLLTLLTLGCNDHYLYSKEIVYVLGDTAQPEIHDTASSRTYTLSEAGIVFEPPPQNDETIAADTALEEVEDTSIVEEIEEVEEICDGIDNNGDGNIDEEGCECIQVNNFDNSYLFCNNTPLSWDDAEAYCNTYGYNLVTITTDIEDEWLEESTSVYSVGYAWTGLRKDSLDDQWKWTSGLQVLYTDWRHNEPSSDGRCMELRVNPSDTSCWNDIMCHLERYFICSTGY